MSENDVVEIKRGDNSSCKIHRFGATVISWLNEGEEHIFISSKALFDNKKAIRGGIPLVFPNFGPWDLGPQHGFARISRWNLESQNMDQDGNPCATFTLKENEDTLKMWNFKFTLTYKVTLLANTLKTEFSVTNSDSKNFDFTCLLHTYFKTPDVAKTTVSGLQGLTYMDKVQNVGVPQTESRELVTVAENVDRVYEKTPPEHQITGLSGGKTITLSKQNLPDTVVWNPWKEKAAAMSDFGDDDYPLMICVEAGYVSERKVLGPGETFATGQTMTVQ